MGTSDFSKTKWEPNAFSSPVRDLVICHQCHVILNVMQNESNHGLIRRIQNVHLYVALDAYAIHAKIKLTGHGYPCK